MKTIFLLFIVLPLMMVSSSCERTNRDVTPIKIITDKEIYSVNESIKLEIINSKDSIARYFVCSSYKGIPPNIYKLENSSWTFFWGPICNGYSSYCCNELQKGASYKDTLEIEFEIGTYRIEYQFIVRPNHEYKSYFSNPIKFE
jgi:hypothetical protein